MKWIHNKLLIHRQYIDSLRWQRQKTTAIFPCKHILARDWQILIFYQTEDSNILFLDKNITRFSLDWIFTTKNKVVIKALYTQFYTHWFDLIDYIDYLSIHNTSRPLKKKIKPLLPWTKPLILTSSASHAVVILQYAIYTVSQKKTSSFSYLWRLSQMSSNLWYSLFCAQHQM